MGNQSAAIVQKLLGELEYRVMEIVWKHPRVTVREVVIELAKQRQLAYTTVMTVMSRLAEKGFLRQHRVGRAYIYEAAYTPEELAVEIAGDKIRSILSDFGSVAVAEFVHQIGQIDPQQLHRLAQLAQKAVDDDSF